MRLLVIVVTGLLAGALAIVGLAPAAPGGESGVVARVQDGDTLTLRDGRRIRLVQIDAPEVGECYAREARSALLALAPVGSRVALEADPVLDKVDRYGRLLRYVRRGGVNANLELVRVGAAATYFYRGERGRYAGKLAAAARAARSAGRGLWKGCGAVPRAAAACDPNYTGGCVPPYPPDVDCADVRALGIAPVRVVGTDPHRLDGDSDGWGCE